MSTHNISHGAGHAPKPGADLFGSAIAGGMKRSTIQEYFPEFFQTPKRKRKKAKKKKRK